MLPAQALQRVTATCFALKQISASSSRQLFAIGSPAYPRAPFRLVCRAEDQANGASVASEVSTAAAAVDIEEVDVKLECDESGCVFVISGGSASELEEEDSSQGVLQCNVSGCFYAAPPPSKEFTVLEGAGWRLGFETLPASEESYSAMVGAGGWSIALTASEFNDFCKLIQMLRKGIITMDKDGVLGRDDIVMQVEVGSMWMECVVPKRVLPNLQNFLKFGSSTAATAFEIRFILTGKADKRQAEGYWPADAVMDMLKKIDELSATKSKAVADEIAVPA